MDPGFQIPSATAPTLEADATIGHLNIFVDTHGDLLHILAAVRNLKEEAQDQTRLRDLATLVASLSPQNMYEFFSSPYHLAAMPSGVVEDLKKFVDRVQTGAILPASEKNFDEAIGRLVEKMDELSTDGLPPTIKSEMMAIKSLVQDVDRNLTAKKKADALKLEELKKLNDDAMGMLRHDCDVTVNANKMLLQKIKEIEQEAEDRDVKDVLDSLTMKIEMEEIDERKLQEHQQANAEKDGQIEALHARIQELKAAVAQLGAVNDQLASDKAQLAVDKDQLAKDKIQLRAANDQLENDKTQLATENKEMTARWNSFASHFAAYAPGGSAPKRPRIEISDEGQNGGGVN